MRNKVAKQLRREARRLTTNYVNDPIQLERFGQKTKTLVYPKGTFKSMYKILKSVFKSTTVNELKHGLNTIDYFEENKLMRMN